MKNRMFNFITHNYLTIILILVILILIQMRSELLAKVDTLSEENLRSKNIYNTSIKTYDSITKKLISYINTDTIEYRQTNIQGFYLNNEYISIEELLKTTNTSLEENIELKIQIEQYLNAINVIMYKYGIQVEKDSINKLIVKNNPNSKYFEVEKKLNDEVDRLNTKIQEKEFILNYIKDRYGIKYELSSKGNKTILEIPHNKLDSALILYPYYKHKLKIDKNGDLIIK